jgi:hypothetical protein
MGESRSLPPSSTTWEVHPAAAGRLPAISRISSAAQVTSGRRSGHVPVANPWEFAEMEPTSNSLPEGKTGVQSLPS